MTSILDHREQQWFEELDYAVHKTLQELTDRSKLLQDSLVACDPHTQRWLIDQHRDSLANAVELMATLREFLDGCVARADGKTARCMEQLEERMPA